MPEYQLLDILAHARMKSIPEETSIKYERTRARTLAPPSPRPVVGVFSLPCPRGENSTNSRDNFSHSSFSLVVSGLAGVPLRPPPPPPLQSPRPLVFTLRIHSRLQPERRRGSVDVRGWSRGRQRSAERGLGSRQVVVTRHRAEDSRVVHGHHVGFLVADDSRFDRPLRGQPYADEEEHVDIEGSAGNLHTLEYVSICVIHAG